MIVVIIYFLQNLVVKFDKYVVFVNQMVNQLMFILHMVNKINFLLKFKFYIIVLRNIDNEIECPILMAYVCPKCGATGKSAHTIKYCTALSENERVALPTVKLLKEGRSSSGNMNLFKK